VSGDKWIQGSVEKPGRVRTYLMREYGTEAFEGEKDSPIKPEYLERAEKRAKESKNLSLQRAINEAKTLKHIAHEKEVEVE
jgi:hypothetical protein